MTAICRLLVSHLALFYWHTAMAEKVYKTENGIQFPAEAYAYVPDPD